MSSKSGCFGRPEAVRQNAAHPPAVAFFLPAARSLSASGRGLLVAMHGRFLERLREEAGAAVAAAGRQPSLARAVAAFVTRVLQAARRHRESILFFVAVSATDSPLRKQGLAANPGFAGAFAAVVMPFREEIPHRNPEAAIDVAFRMLFAVFLQQAMFTPKEATGRAITGAALARELTRCLVLYLTTPM